MIEAEPPQQTETPTAVNQAEENIVVDIKGQVANPGVYELFFGARIQDAIEAAGGFLPAADDRAINLALKVQDEMSIYVPLVGEEAAMPETQSPTGEALVNLNTATEAELTTLPGIGPSKAAAIITYRTDNGNFQQIEDLTKVTGIGEKTFEQLKDAITVN